MVFRLQPGALNHYLQTPAEQRSQDERSHIIKTDVVIAGSGPVAATYARIILEEHPTARVTMVEIGAQDGKILGGHHKNSVKYQKDIDAFVNVIKGALQTVSVPPEDSYLPTLGGDAWTTNKKQVFHGSNPNQVPNKNLKSSGITRTVGGMATHWTCNCPTPHEEEIVHNPIPKAERDVLYERAAKLLNIHPNEYNDSIRHTIVKETLLKGLKSRDNSIVNMPLAVERRKDNPDYVTWSGANTVLGDIEQYGDRFQLLTETRVTNLVRPMLDGLPVGEDIRAVQVRNLHNNEDYFILADAFVVACGAIGTPQILFNSDIRPQPLGRYLCEQSIAFCQIVLKRQLIDLIPNNPEWKKRVEEHHKAFPNDPLHIPYNDPEPQVQISYSHDFPWHCQVHRDAFSYGDVGPRADSRLIVDLRFFGKQEISVDNRVRFGPDDEKRVGNWLPGVTDIYGLPQPTFEVTRSAKDQDNDHNLMKDMCDVANLLGAYLPGSNPQFMEPGLALHITGTTRIGKDPKTSVANPESRVWDFQNLWVGGNGCIPDSTACNPTKTSVMIAIKGARALIHYLEKKNKSQY
ncbi:pyranose 2-oxidase [Pluteus cervinus]|uniref:Pyranose 2-oxidase n=1 Tax=Pluteus cervinus TaxID=181527 RepID=A0ACD3AI10_9AGAR|nr:pyranose 2-oxidase [Pluteus cervinus]